MALDASRSMAAGGGTSGQASTQSSVESAWTRATRRSAELAAEGAEVVLFGEDIRPVAADSLATVEPDAPRSRLAPLLERAAESGVGELAVLSDLRFEDPVAVAATAQRLGLRVTFEDVGVPGPNAGIEELRLAPQARADEALEGEVALFGGGGAGGAGGAAGDSATLEVREEGRLVLSERVALPAEGRTLRVPLRLPAPGGRGELRYVARVQADGDAFAEDDERVAYTEVGPEEGMLVLLSLRPDWEPRFLLPVIGQATGLPARGLLRVAPDRWLPLGGGAEREAPAADEAAQALVRGAELLVVHGWGDEPPAWLPEAAAGARRLLLFPDRPQVAEPLGVSIGAPLAGEWYPAEELPSSPLAAELAGVSFEGLPPLTRVLPLVGGEGSAQVPLRVQLRGAGQEVAALALAGEPGRRRAVVLGDGWWRWAFREGAPRDAYRRFWSAVAGWLLAEEPLARGPGVRPATRVVAAADEVVWRAPGLTGQRVGLRVSRGDTVVLDTALAVPDATGFRTPALPPGSYRYESRVGDEPPVAGRLDVEGYSPELRHARMAPPDPPAAASAGLAARAGAGRPLRTHPLPYLLLLGLLAGEWAVRRRRGLR